MALNFGEAKPAEHGHFGIGDMNVHIYISPAISEEHRRVAQEAVGEFFDLFPDRKDWFKINNMPWVGVENVIKNQPTTPRLITDLLGCYYAPALDDIYKNNKKPLTTVVIMQNNGTSGYMGAGGDCYKHVLILDLNNTEFLKSVIKHELGHRFGCHHCEDDRDCIMNSSGIGTHFCQKHLKEMKMRIATLYANSRPFTFGQKEVKKYSFNFGKRGTDTSLKSSR